MYIKSSKITHAPLAVHNGSGASPAPKPESPGAANDYVTISVSKDQVKNAVVKGAFATGGALAGVGLGVVTGGALAQMTGFSSLTTAGGVLGALGGAGTAYAVSGKDDKQQTLTTVALGWGGASVGAIAGQWAIGGILGALGEAAGSGIVAGTAPLVGTTAGSAVAAAIALSGEDSELAKTVQTGGAIAGLGTLGLTVGTTLRSLMVYNEVAGHAAAFAPVMGAVSGGLLGLSLNSKNPGSLQYKLAAPIGLGTVGYGLANVLGMAVTSAGGSVAYTYGLPLAGTIVGGALGLADMNPKYDKPAGTIAASTLGASLGTMAGDLGGHLLSSVCQQTFHTQMGPVMGAVGGALAGLEAAGIDTKGGAQIVGGAAGGWVAGGLAGSALSLLTGHPIYSQVGSVIGAVNGGTQVAESTGKLDTRGAGITLMGATAGVGVGAALGAAIETVTGQSFWGVALPALGGVAGGLSGLAHVLTRDDGAK